jgi:hypothetical protein
MADEKTQPADLNRARATAQANLLWAEAAVAALEQARGLVTPEIEKATADEVRALDTSPEMARYARTRLHAVEEAIDLVLVDVRKKADLMTKQRDAVVAMADAVRQIAELDGKAKDGDTDALAKLAELKKTLIARTEQQPGVD